jgi:hypothetical protein
MTKPAPWLTASVLTVAIVAARATAEGAPMRPCANGDLNGTYVLVDYRESPNRGFYHERSTVPLPLSGFLFAIHVVGNGV